jgi:hypothetical protein
MPYLLIAVPALIILLCAFIYAEWEEFDDYRRLERRAHLNLLRQGGEWDA